MSIERCEEHGRYDTDKHVECPRCETSGPLLTNAKLSSGQRNILALIRKGAQADGWAPVSKVVAPIFTNKDAAIPVELCEFEPVGEGGRARLTEMGRNVLDAMEWL